MPTSVSTVRQCLAKEAVHALNDAVAVAHRRGHAQTTSLHLISSLLSQPSSSLREACSRTRNNAYSIRIQFKALDLCLGVSLDRLPLAPTQIEEPPVSNSLMAAIKRSQGNQRRQPENFNFYQQQLLCSSSSSVNVVKVELRNLIISILDDPVVSRVLAEAGFSSCEIKVAILRPVHQLFRSSRYKWPQQPAPMFLSNLNGDQHLNRRGFTFPFIGYSEVVDGEENCNRIGNVMERDVASGRRNPLLVGVCAFDSLKSFLGMFQRRRARSDWLVNLSGLGVISVEDDILRYVSGNCEGCLMKKRFEEVSGTVENCVGPGVVVNFGDLKVLASDDASFDALSFVVSELTNLLVDHRRKVWLIGAVAAYETYLKFSKMFPLAEKELDLQLLPITTARFSVGKSYPKSSLMESFVPFGGFFSAPSDVKSTLSSSFQRKFRCHLCDEKCLQEVNSLSDGRFGDSIPEANECDRLSPLHLAESNTDNGSHILAQKDEEIWSTKISRLHRKWDNICQNLHYGQGFHKVSNHGFSPQAHAGSPAPKGGIANDESDSSFRDNALTHNECKRGAMTLMSMDAVASGNNSPTSLLSKASNMNFPAKFSKLPSEAIVECRLGSSFNPSTSVEDGLISPASVTSVTIDLNVELNSTSMRSELGDHLDKSRVNLGKNLSTNQCADLRNLSRSELSNVAKSFSSHFHGNTLLDQKDFKMLYAALAKRIGWQEEVVKVISQTIVDCRSRTEKPRKSSRGDIWFSLLGPDQLGKRKLAIALAETLYGSRENLIHVDLSCSNAMSDFETRSKYHVSHRGKHIVDYIAEKLSTRPLSVVLLENIDKADLLLQQTLSQAVKNGRFPDSHGREVSINNTIFVTSQSIDELRKSYPDTSHYSEEDVSSAECSPIHITIGIDLCDNLSSSNTSISYNKRKHYDKDDAVKQLGHLELAKRVHRSLKTNLDLNTLAEDDEISDSSYERNKKWLEDFLGQVHAEVSFQPFDFDGLASNILQDVTDCFQKAVGSECCMEIDHRVMMQMVASAYVGSKQNVEDWIKCILTKGFEEAQEKYSITTRSIVKVVACEGVIAKEETTAGFLPSKIIVN